jgi:hypothetical protein
MATKSKKTAPTRAKSTKTASVTKNAKVARKSKGAKVAKKITKPKPQGKVVAPTAAMRTIASVVPSATAGSFTGQVYADDAKGRVYIIDGTNPMPMMTEGTECDNSDGGFDDAYQDYGSKRNQTITVSGTKGGCVGHPVIFLS